MDDPHRRPADRDRADLVARIRRAADEGRIGATDRDIRLGNVASAQSMAELDLIGRDLDQLETAVPAGSAAAPVWSGPGRQPLGEELGDLAVGAARTTARSVGVGTALLLVLVLAGFGASAFFAVRGSSGPESPGVLQVPSPISESAVPSDGTGSGEPPAAGPAYSLTGRGIRAFLASYRERFGTAEVLDLTLYGDYVIVSVPVPGKARHEGWLYRNDDGFTDFGGVTANFPGAEPVDTDDLAIPALVRNIARAQSTLGVEDPTTTYVIVRHYTSADAVPSVDIHVTNAFNESGYLATTLDGDVERAYPYTS